MKLVLISALVLTLLGCATTGTAVIKRITDSDVCGPGPVRLIPTDGGLYLVLCEDGRVLWIDEEDL